MYDVFDTSAYMTYACVYIPFYRALIIVKAVAGALYSSSDMSYLMEMRAVTFALCDFFFFICIIIFSSFLLFLEILLEILFHHRY